MAARRLLIIMVLLLAISTIAAALVPAPERRTDEARPTTSSAPSMPKDERPDGGELVATRVPASGGARDVRVSVGDQLSLVVSRATPGDVSVPSFGLIDYAEPGAPARFDLLLERPGRFEVTAEGEGVLATIVVGSGDVNPEARPGGRRR